MSDISEVRRLLRQYASARIPFVAVNTIEKDRALSVLQDISQELQFPFYVSSLSRGIYDIATNKVIQEEGTFYDAISYMRDQMKRRSYLTLVMSDIPDLTGDTPDARELLAMVHLANESGGMIIVLTEQSIWDRLQRFGMTVKLDLPNEEEMYGIIAGFINDYRNDIMIEWDESDLREAASTLQGATRIEAENVIASLIANRIIRKSDMDEVRHAKDRLFTDISGLEKINVDPSDVAVGGLEGLTRWLSEKKQLLTPAGREMLRARGLRPPRGILLVGVPGCGKSLSAKAISAGWKLPLYRLDFATVQGSYVGQSEQQLRNALATAESVAPCVLWIDEIEKGLSGAGSSNDGGVSTRMVGQFLFWLQECRKNVFVVATANDVTKLPSELLRRGRFDEMFFVDLPTDEERRSIIGMYMAKYLNLRFDGPLADRIVEMTEGFTGADLEATVRDLAYRQIASPDFVMTEESVLSAFSNVVPLSQTSPEKIDAIREWGRERAVPASGRPIGADKLNKPAHVKPRVLL